MDYETAAKRTRDNLSCCSGSYMIDGYEEGDPYQRSAKRDAEGISRTKNTDLGLSIKIILAVRGT